MAYIFVNNSDAIIAYGGTWDDRNTSAHWAVNPSSSASIVFNGTALWAYGYFDPNKAEFTCFVDGERLDANASQFRWSADVNDNFFEILLDDGTHNFFLSVTQGDFGLSCLEWYNPQASTLVGPPIYGSVDSFGGWAVSTAQDGAQMSSTRTASASIDFIFQGTGIAVTGFGGPDAGSFNVTLDGMEPIIRNAWTQYANHSIILHRNDGLPDGNHILTLTNLENKLFQVGQAQIFIAPPNVTTTNSTVPAPTLTPNWPATPTAANIYHNGPSIGKVLGIMIAVLGCLSLLSVALWFWLRKRRTPQDIYKRNQVTYGHMCSKCSQEIDGKYRLECVDLKCPAAIDLHPECGDWNTPEHHSHEIHQVPNN